MGTAKRHRKIQSGRKMARRAVRKAQAAHAIQIVAMTAMWRTSLAVMQAQQMKRGGASSAEVVNFCKGELVLPMEELRKVVANLNQKGDSDKK